MLKKRIVGLDIFRGTALFLMIIYHFIYDLNHFQLIQINMDKDPTFMLFRYMIISMFLLSVGMSLALVHQNGINWRAVSKRTLQLSIAALSVTIATYIIFPQSWIYFGVLHFILLSSLLVLPLLKYPTIILLLMLSILIGSATNTLHMHGLFSLLQEPLFLPSPHTEDLVPLVPWFALVLLGVLMVQHNVYQKFFKQKIFSLNFAIHKLLKKMGQHSLAIYLIHQLILFGAFELYFTFFSK